MKCFQKETSGVALSWWCCVVMRGRRVRNCRRRWRLLSYSTCLNLLYPRRRRGRTTAGGGTGGGGTCPSIINFLAFNALFVSSIHTLISMGGPGLIDGELVDEVDNFWPCEFGVEGVVYRSTEKYFQWFVFVTTISIN